MEEAKTRTGAIYFDGLCEPVNPGGVATFGFIIKDETGCGIAAQRGVIAKGKEATNNLAEWCALGKALRWLLDWKEFQTFTDMDVYGDSQLVINQMTGAFACNNERLRQMRDRCREIIEELDLTVRYTWIPREQNSEADLLSREAYREETGKDPPERKPKPKKQTGGLCQR